MRTLKKILTNLDTLLDTRLGTLSVLDPKAASIAVSTPEYWLREYNDWVGLTHGRIDNATFNARYQNRDDEVMLASVATGISPVLLKFLGATDVNAVNNMADDVDIGLEVNIAPYSLSTEELDELTAILQKTYGRCTPISFCDVPLDELTPTYLRERYAMAVLYDFHEWIVRHDRELMSARTPCFNFIGPKLFEHDPRRLSVEQKKDEFTRLRLFKLEFMDFEFIDVKYMSMLRPERQSPNT